MELENIASSLETGPNQAATDALGSGALAAARIRVTLAATNRSERWKRGDHGSTLPWRRHHAQTVAPQTTDVLPSAGECLGFRT